VQAGDVLLLCSDGLTGMISEAEMERILEAAGSLGDAGRALVAAANEAGGRDNITVVLFRVEDVAVGGGAAAGDDVTRIGGTALRTQDVRDALATAEAPAAPAPPRVVPPRGSPERARAPLPRRVKLLAATAATLVVIGALAFAGWLASRAVYFVGTNSNGMVTIYRGLPWELPAGIHLYEQFYVSGVPAGIVPAGRRSSLLDHRLRSQDDAENLISELELGRLAR
jgi:protein phosphatase